ncbi:universal stress protein [Mucilaginibacter psychrotolerans]|uniref:Universal stress protein n=1 Tax=Mucilaginibacter psychrotolerans TaxID=1524096 RepID=A0A4Y8SJG3_9SPHI|nr:universal stress protein [Mucilaginibacter psychrotolerans]TFF38536.1 universal stress protein [Mucilaginibacter psychrotolerans]
MMAPKKTILLLTDFSKRAEHAADFALELAKNNHANLLIYNSIISIGASVITGERWSVESEITEMTAKSTSRLSLLTTYLKAKLTTSQQSAIQITCKNGTGPVVETIIELVAENKIWMVVMGNHVENAIAITYFDGNIPPVMNNCGCPLLLVP